MRPILCGVTANPSLGAAAQSCLQPEVTGMKAINPATGIQGKPGSGEDLQGAAARSGRSVTHRNLCFWYLQKTAKEGM